MQRTLVLASMLIAAAGASCKPKAGGAGVKDIAGTNENGQKVSLALVSVRNLTFAQDALKASGNDQIQYARKLMSQPLFALVECADYLQGGALVESGASMLARIKALSFMSNLFLDEQRALVSFEASSKDKEAAKQLDRKVVHNCAVKSYRLLSYPVIEDVFIRINGLPASRPTDAARLESAHRAYTVAQSIYLALRDNYEQGKPADESLMVNKLRQMAVEYGDTNREDFRVSLASADPFYNPCIQAQGLPWWVAEFKKDYACVPVRGRPEQRTFAPGGGALPEQRTFAPGGGAQASYVSVRDRLTTEILDTHAELFANRASGVYALWDLLSGMGAWSAAKGASAELAAFLNRPDTEAHFAQILAKLRNAAALTQGVALTELSGPRVAEKLHVNATSGLNLAGSGSGPTLGFNNRSSGSPLYGAGKAGKPGGGGGGGGKSPTPTQPNNNIPSPTQPGGGRGGGGITPPTTQPMLWKNATSDRDGVVHQGDENFFPRDSNVYRPGAKNFLFDSHQEGADYYKNANGDRRFNIEQRALDANSDILTQQEKMTGETKWTKTTNSLGQTQYDHKETSDASQQRFTEQLNESTNQMIYTLAPLKDARGQEIAPGRTVAGALAQNPYNVGSADQSTQSRVVGALIDQKSSVTADIDRKADTAISNISQACGRSAAEVAQMRSDAVRQVRDDQQIMKQQLSAAAEHSRLSGDAKRELAAQMAEFDVHADDAVNRIATARPNCGAGVSVGGGNGGNGPLAFPASGGGGGGGNGPLAFPGSGLHLADGDGDCDDAAAEQREKGANSDTPDGSESTLPPPADTANENGNAPEAADTMPPTTFPETTAPNAGGEEP